MLVRTLPLSSFFAAPRGCPKQATTSLMSHCAWRVVCLVSPCTCKPKETVAGRTIIRHASLSIPGSISTLAVVGATSSGLPCCKSLTGSGGADQLVACGVGDGQGLACQHRFVDRTADFDYADAVTPAVSTRTHAA